MKINIISITTHSCYILKSTVSNKIYIGYTVDFKKRIRQHNGEIKGGAKRTKKGRPWHPICLIKGFEDASTALRFEFRLQHYRRNYKKDPVLWVIDNLIDLIKKGDGSIIKKNKKSWPELVIHWYDKYSVPLENVLNEYEHESQIISLIL
jgi:predicted GIY-YIG superfamily endonuclease